MRLISNTIAVLLGSFFLDCSFSGAHKLHAKKNRTHNTQRLRSQKAERAQYGVVKAKVIIIGAGVSGVSAAKALKAAGIEDVLILEARSDVIGGRMHQGEFPPGSGRYVEQGSNWIQGVGSATDINPLFLLALKHNLTLTPSDSTNATYRDVNGLYDQDAFLSRLDDFGVAIDDLTALSDARRQANLLDVSVRTTFLMNNWNPTSPLDNSIEWNNFDWFWGDSPDVTSTTYAGDDATYSNFGEDDFFVVDQRGYKHILEEEAKAAGFGYGSSRLKLGKIVTNIQWGDRKDSPVTVTCGDGTIYVGNYVISTLSIGVLQNTDVAFTPALPQWKLESIFTFRMTTYTKIFLAFPNKFWDDTEFVWYGDARRGVAPNWQNLDAPTYQPFFENDHIFFVTVVNEESYRIEAQSDEETRNEMMGVLRIMYGNDIPEATAILVPRWHSDPLFRGSFSLWPIGMSDGHFDNLRAPVSRLWFTGEHMSRLYFGYAHGAWLEGEATGKAVAKCIKSSCPKYPYHPVLVNGNQVTKFTSG